MLVFLLLCRDVSGSRYVFTYLAQQHNEEYKDWTFDTNVEVKCQMLSSGGVKAFLRVCAQPPLVPCPQVVTFFHVDIEGPRFIVVADVQEDLAAHLGIAIVTSLAVHAHHAVDAALWGQHKKSGWRCETGRRLERFIF